MQIARWTPNLVDKIGLLLEESSDAAGLLGGHVEEAAGGRRLDLRGIPLGR